MKDKFNQLLWELGLENPEAQATIARVINSPTLYSIPTREYIREHPSDQLPTGKDIHAKVFDIEDLDQREKAIARIKEADATTVKELSLRLNALSIALTLKEIQGETLTAQERTLKDLDLPALAYTLLYINYPKEAFETFENGEAFKERITELRGH